VVGETTSISFAATDGTGATDVGYTGTVHISSDPETSTLPDDYTFTEADEGVHTFEGIIFNALGTYTLTLVDTSDSLRTQSVTITVTAVDEGSNNNSDNSSSNSSGGSSSAPVCNDSKPLLKPDLFQIDAARTTAKIFFIQLPDTNRYYISFSEKPIAEDYGAEVTLAREGVQNFTVNFLKPNTIYYFKVRGQNGCMPGDWSNIMKVKTGAAGTKSTISYYKNVFVKFTSGITNLFKPSTSSNANPTIQATPVPSPQALDVNTVPSSAPVPTAPPKSEHCFLWWCW
jgi:hypothetical protein